MNSAAVVRAASSTSSSAMPLASSTWSSSQKGTSVASGAKARPHQVRAAGTRASARPRRRAAFHLPRCTPPPVTEGIVVSESTDEEIQESQSAYMDENGRLQPQLEAAIPADFYSLLQVESSDDPAEIKKAYRELQKWCHPDIAGEAGTEVCVILNEAYDTLMDDKAREVYDRDLAELRFAETLGGSAGDDDFTPYTGEPISVYKGADPSGEERAVFVNEATCIGCQQCVHSSPKTFLIEQDYGRARAYTQWNDEEDNIQAAIESCPVDCIYWVKQRNLPILEYAMQRCERAGISSMVGGNVRVGDPFDVANTMIRKGEEARMRMGMDPNTALEGAAMMGGLGMRIREAFMQLDDKVRSRWESYSAARSSLDSMDEGEYMDTSSKPPWESGDFM